MHIGTHTPEALTPTAWRKSSYSGGSNGNCLEVSHTLPEGVPVRDSKAPDGPVITFGSAAFAAFLGAVREDAI